MKQYITIFVCGSLLAMLAGCSPYLDGYDYVPRPAIADVPPAPPQTYPPATVMASIIGVRRADSNANIPLSVELRMRIRNNGPLTVAFDPASVVLSNGALMQFPPPIIDNPSVVTLAPGQEATVDALFPFPGGHGYSSPAMNSLTVRWTLLINGQQAPQIVYFQRIWNYYGQPYYNPPPIWLSAGFIFGGGGGHGGHGGR